MGDSRQKMVGRCQVCGAPLPPGQIRNCSAACRRKAWELAHRDDRLRYFRNRRLQNPEFFRAQGRDWYADNSARAREISRTWSLPNRDRKRIHNQSRRARVAGADSSGRGVTLAECNAILLSYAYACAYCGQWTEALTMDHRVPIARGGQHVAANIIPACRTCNAKKGTTTEEEFRARLNEGLQRGLREAVSDVESALTERRAAETSLHAAGRFVWPGYAVRRTR